MKKILFILLFFVFYFNIFEIKAQTNAQIENAINKQGFRIKMLSLHNGDSLRMYVRLQNDFKEKQNITHITTNYVFEYYVMQDYRSAKPTSIKVNPQQITQEDDGVKFYFQIPRQNVPSGLLFFEMTSILDNTKYKIDQKISFTNTRIRDEFAVFSQKSAYPCFNGYVSQGEIFTIKNIAQKEILIRCFFYKNTEISTDMALAPMNLTKNANTKREEDLFSIYKSNEYLSFAPKGLCLFKKDTADFYGLSLRIEDKNFPKMAEKTDLIAALTYILKNNEIEKFSEIIKKDNQKENENEIKQELDKFFLVLAEGNEENARNIIKRYYQRVKEANMTFSTHKEGWKTDMGMIFTLLGTPTETLKGRDVIQWTYLSNPAFAKAIFTFSRRASAYTDEHYVLARYTEYSTIWQLVVDNWRK